MGSAGWTVSATWSEYALSIPSAWVSSLAHCKSKNPFSLQRTWARLPLEEGNSGCNGLILSFLVGDLRWRTDIRKGVLMILFLISWKHCLRFPFTLGMTCIPLFSYPLWQFLRSNLLRYYISFEVFANKSQIIWSAPSFMICCSFSADCWLNSEEFSGHLAWLSFASKLGEILSCFVLVWNLAGAAEFCCECWSPCCVLTVRN